ncbi:Molecular chaperones GRP170/SIL1, HSP70 superfamily [Phaffia rhodozyma]|uniref:Molecular chaperones GRP170/SIL1, HSP70 superfamily n=1 Tax=Phaffia rhodozyma TaxID=264483 RepID=A0A0F7SXJ8_PHARH|nr:Molecular chaperones GRP170/SIL1, HSP70 superfamily [Phaffia rhodozyma]
MLSPRALLPLLALLLQFHSAFASILAIDYGSEFTKISLVKPGVPIDLVLNKDSKRKVGSVVGWKKDERLFGGEASAVSGRFPHDSFPYLKPHLGAPFESNTTTLFPTVLTPHSSRPTLSFSSPTTKEIWSVEELIGMQFSYARQLAEDLAGERVTDAIVTVPGWFTQFHREAVIDALEIGGLKSVGLINDGTAVGMNFAMTRQFPTKEYHLIYDSGSLSTSVTLLSFHTYPVVPHSSLLTKSSKIKVKPVNTTHVEVHGLGYDTELGGTHLDLLIKNILVAQVEEKMLGGQKGEGKEWERALGKLGKEAARVKGILSANSDAAVGIESLYDDRDFRTRISREELELAAQDLITTNRFGQPILDALEMANMTAADINSLILFGGNSRVPMVQAAIKAAIGEDKIAQNVNTDEGAVLGAAFYGATQSRQFKTKDYKVTDIQPYDIQLSYVAESNKEESEPRTVHMSLFRRGSKTNVKKVFSMVRKGDFELQISYKNSEESTVLLPSEISTVSITGLSDAIQNLTNSTTDPNADAIANPLVRLTVEISDAGLVHVVDATGVFAVDSAKEGSKGWLKGLFKGGKDGKDELEVGEGEKTGETEGEIVEKLVPLKVKVSGGAIPKWTAEQKKEARSRLLSIDALEIARRQREEAFNRLEGYMYRLRDLLAPEKEGSIFFQFSTPEERELLRTGQSDTLEWLSEDGWDAPTKELIERRTQLENIEHPVQFRNTEAVKRAKSIEDFRAALWAGRAFLADAQTNNTADVSADRPAKYSESELNDVRVHLAGLEEWFGAKLDEQHNRPAHLDPVLLTKEVDSKGIDFQDKVMKMIRRKPPVKKPVVKAKKEEGKNETKNETKKETGEEKTEKEEPTEAKSADEEEGSNSKPSAGHDEL